LTFPGFQKQYSKELEAIQGDKEFTAEQYSQLLMDSIILMNFVSRPPTAFQRKGFLYLYYTGKPVT